MNIFRLFVLALFFAPLALAGAVWHDSLAEAQQAAAAQGKDVLIVYAAGELERPGSAELQLICSPYFTGEAEQNYVLVSLPAPVSRNYRDAEVRNSCLVFTDASGRPYYCADVEWEWGMDWLLEELTIAAERRAVVAPIWQEMAGRAPEMPEWRFARRLFETMPVGIERYHAPSQALLEEAARQGDHSQAERAAQQKLMQQRSHALLDDIVASCTTFRDMAAYAEAHAEELQPFPAFRQALQMTQAAVDHFFAMSQNPYALFSDEVVQQVEQVYHGIIAEEPRTKMARFIRSQCLHLLHSTNVGMMTRSSCKLDPQKALEDLEAYAGRDASFRFRQALGLMRGRVLAELGQWDAALESLAGAYAANPNSRNAASAVALAQAIVANRERLEELLPLRRQGDEQVDAEWDALLAGEFDIGVQFPVSHVHDLFYGGVLEPTAGAGE